MATTGLRIDFTSPTPALRSWCLLPSPDRVQYPGSATWPSSIFSRVKLNIASKGSAPAPSAYVAVAFPSLCLSPPLRVLRSDVDTRKSSDVNKYRSSDKDKDKRKPRGRGPRVANRAPAAERRMDVDNDEVQSAPMVGTSDALIPEDALFLGFDSSTQSLKATVLDARLRLVHSESIQFDAALPKYATQGGVHRCSSEDGRVTAPTLMWVEALELLMEKLRDSGCPLHSVRAISGSGQQHGSVYWARGARSILQSLNSSEGLGTQLRNAFAINDSPIWMDSSTHKQCKAIEDAVGGPEALAVLTGSRAHERFTASQIRKIYETRRVEYDNCERISLISSFMASLLIGDYASIDHGDGGGMNLMDLKAKAWSEVVLKAVAPALEDKLGPLAAPFSVAGAIHPYFVERYGFRPNCEVVHWSGDNLCSLAGLALDRPGDLAVSLGTSDTVFGVVEKPNPRGDGHVFPNPVDPHSYMAMLVYKNGAFVREDIRDQCAGHSWESFSQKLDQTPPLNDGCLGFYYKDPEITPAVSAGVRRFQISPAIAKDPERLTEMIATKASSFDDATEVRALIEGQFLAMRAHSEGIGMPSPPRRIIATGGGSANSRLLSILASIFGCDVFTAPRPDSASLGAALRAAHGWLCKEQEVVPVASATEEEANGKACEQGDNFLPFSVLIKHAAPDSAIGLELAATAGGQEMHESYGRLMRIRQSLEAKIIREAGRRA